MSTVKWKQRLAKAKARGKFTDDDIERAGDWPTCAVGEHERALPGSRACPNDDELFFLGCQFSGHVEHGRIAKALATYNKINARVKELVAIKEPRP